MFNTDSRYANHEQKTYETDDGRKIKYVSRRIIPHARPDQIRGSVIVKSEQRLDHASDNAFGAPKQYWRLCDANRIMNPLTVDEGDEQELQVQIPGQEGAT